MYQQPKQKSPSPVSSRGTPWRWPLSSETSKNPAPQPVDISRWAKIPTIFVVGEMSKSSKKPELAFRDFGSEQFSELWIQIFLPSGKLFNTEESLMLETVPSPYPKTPRHNMDPQRSNRSNLIRNQGFIWRVLKISLKWLHKKHQKTVVQNRENGVPWHHRPSHPPKSNHIELNETCSSSQTVYCWWVSHGYTPCLYTMKVTTKKSISLFYASTMWFNWFNHH